MLCYIRLSHLRAQATSNRLRGSAAFEALLPTAPRLKSGDFGEILVRSLLQERPGSPRFPLRRWRLRPTRDATVQGLDLIGYRLADSTPSPDDLLVIAEVKTRSRKRKKTIIKEAFAGAQQGLISRLANELYFQELNLRMQGSTKSAAAIERFANPHRYGDYRKRLSVAIVHDNDIWKDDCLEHLPDEHKLPAEVEVLIIRVPQLARWISEMRQAAIDKADKLCSDSIAEA